MSVMWTPERTRISVDLNARPPPYHNCSVDFWRNLLILFIRTPDSAQVGLKRA
jgi:hypothetical protein